MLNKIFLFLSLSILVSAVFFIESASAGVCDYSRGQITSISPVSVYNNILTINGSGFGTRRVIHTDPSNTIYDRGVAVVFDYLGSGISRGFVSGFRGTNDYEDQPQNSKVLSWTDNKIEIKLLDDFESGFLGMINGGVTGRQRSLNTSLGAYVIVYNYRQTSVFNGVPIYELESGNEAYEICANPFYSQIFTYIPSCNVDTWSCGAWSQCAANGTQTRNCTITFNCPFSNTVSPATSQSCVYIPPTCSSWSYSDWSSCNTDGHQTRTVLSASPNNCVGGNSVLSQSCTYVPQCTSWEYSAWGPCSLTGQQSRSIVNSIPSGCSGGRPILTQPCTPPPSCTSDTWTCGSWSTCSIYGSQTRSCTKTFDCSTADTPSPITSQSCTPPVATTPSWPSLQPNQSTQPTCSEDDWSCRNWSSCSPQGIQTRSCRKTYDCSFAETPAPATSQYCENQSTPPTQSSSRGSSPSTNSESENINQDNIIQATVKLICLVSQTSGKQGTGTIIDPRGIILTNKHVVEGTRGCVVGFTNSSEDDPSFTEVADITRLSNTEDIGLLRIRNNDNKTFPSIDISRGAIGSRNLGNRIMIFGFPGIGGTKLTYSDGSLSGFGSTRDGLGSYLKTTAVIEHGNSGGGAYLSRDGSFIGIPSAGIKGELASIGYILSINRIRTWLSSSGLAYDGNFNSMPRALSRVSLSLENIDTDNIESLNVAEARVSIYSSRAKTTLLPNNPGTVQTANRPTFQINNLTDSDIAGYYVYFGTNINANPVSRGRYARTAVFTPSIIRQKGIYYFIFKAKDRAGNISDAVITEYRYKK